MRVPSTSEKHRIPSDKNCSPFLVTKRSRHLWLTLSHSRSTPCLSRTCSWSRRMLLLGGFKQNIFNVKKSKNFKNTRRTTKRIQTYCNIIRFHFAWLWNSLINITYSKKKATYSWLSGAMSGGARMEAGTSMRCCCFLHSISWWYEKGSGHHHCTSNCRLFFLTFLRMISIIDNDTRAVKLV